MIWQGSAFACGLPRKYLTRGRAGRRSPSTIPRLPCVATDGERAGRYGWSGGLGTNFFVDPDGTVGVLLSQVEMGERMQILLDEFRALAASIGSEG
jgi:hypothetical protein